MNCIKIIVTQSLDTSLRARNSNVCIASFGPIDVKPSTVLVK